MRHVDNEWKGKNILRRRSSSSLLFYQWHAVLYERCLDSQEHCNFPWISLLVVTVLVVVLTKTGELTVLIIPAL